MQQAKVKKPLVLRLEAFTLTISQIDIILREVFKQIALETSLSLYLGQPEIHICNAIA